MWSGESGISKKNDVDILDIPSGPGGPEFRTAGDALPLASAVRAILTQLIANSGPETSAFTGDLQATPAREVTLTPPVRRKWTHSVELKPLIDKLKSFTRAINKRKTITRGNHTF